MKNIGRARESYMCSGSDLAAKVACKPWQVVCFLKTDLVQYLASLLVHQVSKMDMLTKWPWLCSG